MNAVDIERSIKQRGRRSLLTGRRIRQVDRERRIDGAQLVDLRFDVTVAFGVFSNLPNLGVFDLQTGGVEVFELPKPANRVYLDEEEALLLVEHPDQRGYFTVMEGLQVWGYTVVDSCGTPQNQAVTLLSYLHIAFQPMVFNATTTPTVAQNQGVSYQAAASSSSSSGAAVTGSGYLKHKGHEDHKAHREASHLKAGSETWNG